MTRHSFSYFFKEGIRGVFSHGFMSFASTSVITTCLVLTGTVVLLMLTLTATISDLGTTNDIRAYVDETYSDEEAEALEGKLHDPERARRRLHRPGPRPFRPA